jgi:hypothetical protein
LKDWPGFTLMREFIFKVRLNLTSSLLFWHACVAILIIYYDRRQPGADTAVYLSAHAKAPVKHSLTAESTTQPWYKDFVPNVC